MLGDHRADFDLLAWYPKRDAERQIEGSYCGEPLTWWRESFRAEVASRGWSKPPARTKARCGVTPDPIAAPKESNYITPCPHTRHCLNTRACCLLQDIERRHNKPTLSAPSPDPEEEREWYP